MTLERQVVRVDARIVRENLALGRRVYGASEVSLEAHMRWKHVDGPDGASTAVLLRAGDEIVGRMFLQPRSLRLGGELLRGAYLTDLVLHPEHRGLQNFLELVPDPVAAADFDFIYVTPSSTSLPLFETILAYDEPQPLSVMAAPLRTSALLHRFEIPGASWLAPVADALLRVSLRMSARWLGPRSVEVSEGWPTDPEIDALDERLRESSFPAFRRDAAFLHWRLEPAERGGHRMWTVRERGRVVGYFATRTTDAEGFRTCFLIDLLLLPELGRRAVLGAVLGMLEGAAGTEADIALGFFRRENAWLRRICRFPLWRVPERWLPQPVKLFVRPAVAESGESPGLGDAYLTIADLDVY